MGVPVILMGRHDLQSLYGVKVVAKTCIKCNAPLKSNKCEYCGTEYGNKREIDYKKTSNTETTGH